MTFHGVSLNVDPDLSHFSRMTLPDTQPAWRQPRFFFADLVAATTGGLDLALRAAFRDVFVRTVAISRSSP